MKYSVLTFGCRANHADSCQIEHDLQAGGGVPAPSESADVLVVNTFPVHAAAARAAPSGSACAKLSLLGPCPGPGNAQTRRETGLLTPPSPTALARPV